MDVHHEGPPLVLTENDSAAGTVQWRGAQHIQLREWGQVYQDAGGYFLGCQVHFLPIVDPSIAKLAANWNRAKSAFHWLSQHLQNWYFRETKYILLSC